ncbi:hypothetical protein AB6A40_003634 [Gnathostoma spinigerum]|uniref:Uncharacterized protein n=1 Tax=Gnathostoma spinigerum TaxID=75299 RepID=A0ABD6EA57_9BILA
MSVNLPNFWPLTILYGVLLLLPVTIAIGKHHHYIPRRFDLTLSIRNHNVTDSKFFRLQGVGHTADFDVAPGDVFTKTYEVRRKGFWTLFVEFPGDRYAKSPRKIISRDSYRHWVSRIHLKHGIIAH